MTPKSRNEPPHRDQEFWDHAYKSKSNHGNGSGAATTTKIRSDPWQSVSALQLGLQPRSFPELHTERMYLLEMLQQYDKRATELFTRVPIVEEQIHCAETRDTVKQARKLRGWLRHRILDTVEEEKRVLARLSELHVEIQCRERWSWVESQRELLNLGQPPHNPAYAGFPTPRGSPVQPDIQMNPQHPIPSSYYPSYEYIYPPYLQDDEHGSMNGNYSAYGREEEASATRQNNPENYYEQEASAWEGTEISDASGDAPHNLPWSTETIRGPKPTKHRSMPSLIRKWSG
ncbi:hypothetical protein F5Y06DRAFT_294121 [Hypoxylon sp. FL0890]|nr:hypothetical protein F5Y06DRAFT_294121 [Hypoxylon sp. FL0890]